jgi:hypothetical protein
MHINENKNYNTGFYYLCFLSLTSCDGKPVAHFDETTHDFGKVKTQEQTVSYTFTFTNKGTSTLIIDRVKRGEAAQELFFRRGRSLPAAAEKLKLSSY